MHTAKIALSLALSLICHGVAAEDPAPFTGNRGEFPAGWIHFWSPDPKSPFVSANSGLTDDFAFEDAKLVMRLGASPEKKGIMQTKPRPFPDDGEVEFKVWMRAESDEGASAVIFLLGDKYNWNVSKTLALNSSWQEFSLRGRVPKTRKTDDGFWLRIDVTKGSALIAKTACSFIVASTSSPTSGNLLNNPDFRFGSYGWYMDINWNGMKGSEAMDYLAKWKPPCFQPDGSARIAPWTTLLSFNFPMEFGLDYNASLWLKRAERGKPSKLTAILLTHDWNVLCSQKIEATDDWMRFDLRGRSKKGEFKDAYLRLDVKDGGGILLQKAQVATGGEPQAFSTPEKRAGLVGDTLVSASAKNAELYLISSCPVEMTVKDAWGSIVRKESFQTPQEKLPLKINRDGRTGCFHVEFSASGERIGETRYAIMTDLSKTPLPDNPLAGHCNVFFASPDDLALYAKYLPFGNTFNRSFIDSSLETLLATLAHPYFKTALQASKLRNIVVMPNFGGQQGKDSLLSRIQQATSIDAKLAEDYRQYLRSVLPTMRGAVFGVELFNEPMLWRFKDGPSKGELSMPPKKVAELYQIAAPVIKEEAPEIQLVGPCIGIQDEKYAEDFLKAGGGKALDIFSFHGYCSNPDLTGAYDCIKKFHELLKQYNGKDLPVWNTEQYFGARLPRLANGERNIGYFYDTELEHAAVMSVNLIHHAAAGSKFSMFLPFYFWNGFGSERFVLDAAPACNAAVRMLGSAGTGSPLNLGEAVQCFIFPKGRLATIHAIANETHGEMMRPANVAVFDMMGNAIPDDGRRLPISRAPLYIVFPEGTKESAMRAVLADTQFFNLGAPLSAKLFMPSPNELGVAISNRTNKDREANLELADFPKGWEFENIRGELAVRAGETKCALFRIKKSALPNAEPLAFKLSLTSQGEKSSFTLSLKRRIAAEAFKGFDKWSDSAWIALDEANLSKSFSATERWNGPVDLSAKVAFGWNQSGLAISVIVRDDRLVFSDNPALAWGYDSLQLYFDRKGDAFHGEAPAKARDTEGDIDYIVSLVNGKSPVAYLRKGCDRFIGENNQETGVDNAVKVKIEKLPDGLRYDLFFPAECLPSVKFAAGSALGFSILVNDNDGNGRKTGLTLAPKGCEPFGHPEYYSALLFDGEASQR